MVRARRRLGQAKGQGMYQSEVCIFQLQSDRYTASYRNIPSFDCTRHFPPRTIEEAGVIKNNLIITWKSAFLVSRLTLSPALLIVPLFLPVFSFCHHNSACLDNRRIAALNSHIEAGGKAGNKFKLPLDETFKNLKDSYLRLAVYFNDKCQNGNTHCQDRSDHHSVMWGKK